MHAEKIKYIEATFKFVVTKMKEKPKFANRNIDLVGCVGDTITPAFVCVKSMRKPPIKYAAFYDIKNT